MEPQIIPRSKHCISRKNISPNALQILYRLHRKGFIAYLVGGCVRDILLERTPKDFDIATNATPVQIKKLFRNCRLIGRRFRLAHLHFKDEIIEVSTFRRSINPDEDTCTGKNSTNKHALYHVRDDNGMVLRDNLFGTPEEDALCRDFTINALAYNIADFSIVDYSNGIYDLNQRIIRPIGNPYVRFKEDPVRMLRAVRFSASHNLNIEPDTWDAICNLSSNISFVSPARLYEEIQKLFMFGFAKPAFELLYKSGLLSVLFPDFTVWMSLCSTNINLIKNNLNSLDKIYNNGASVSQALFLAGFFGPYIEDKAILNHRNGIANKLALENACNDFMKEICKTTTIPKRIISMLHSVLALQHSLYKTPSHRPHLIVIRPEFPDALMYMQLKETISNENMLSINWWNNLLKQPELLASFVQQTRIKTTKKRRKRRSKQNNTERAKDKD